MSIRNKLLAAVTFSIVVFVIVAGAYLASRAPIARIRTEQGDLMNLQMALQTETIDLNRLTTTAFSRDLSSFQKSTVATRKAFVALNNVTLLPKLSRSIKDALDTIHKLEANHETAVSRFMGAVRAIQTDANQENFEAGSYRVFDLVSKSGALNGGRPNAVLGDYEQLLAGIDSLSNSLVMSAMTIMRQSNTIAADINVIQTRSNRITLVAAFALILLTFAVALFLVYTIAKSIRTIESGIAYLGEGNLTVQFAELSKDELGSLSRNLNRFTATLRDSIQNAQQVSTENVQMKASLMVAAEGASAATRQIDTNAVAIKNRISGLDTDVSRTTAAVDSISGSIRSLNDQIQEQMSMVEQSTASVTQMIASIENIASIADKRLAATEQLVQAVESGGDKMSATLNSVSRINESVDSVRDITGMIESIAAQTNLLAMNAAIEAAHAGESGKGFSVVADEIRKLAEAASENSRQISSILQTIVTQITDAGNSGDSMSSAYREIHEETRQLLESLAEISSSMSELREGGKQILTAMDVLQNVSSNVKEGSTTINGSSRDINNSMKSVEKVSAEVHSDIIEISNGMNDIGMAVQNMLGIAERLGGLGESLNESLTNFQTTA